MATPNVLMLSDTKDMKFLRTQTRHCTYWNIFWMPVDYRYLNTYKEITKNMIFDNNIDFIVYSRNDQVAERKSIGRLTRYLQLGYTSISGIDQKDRILQMKRCFRNFLECNDRLASSVTTKNAVSQDGRLFNGSFSLIFDTEQVGCALYALPRLFNLLKSYNVKATFFLCEILQRIYSNIVEVIRQQNHEIGLHGRWHEYLSKYCVSDQEAAIREMIGNLGGQVYGANFIGRMNKDTILAMMRNNVEYFIRPFINRYRFFGYPKVTNIPISVCDSKQEISMIPVSLETYDLPWFSIKNWVDSALAENTRSHNHLTILLHPFRDGNLQHIGTTELLLNYLVVKKRLKGITLKEFLTEYQSNPKSNLNPKISIRDFKMFEGEKYCFPRTPRDIASAIPENPMDLVRATRKGTSLW